MKILHLPLWIPTKADIQLGNFIHQQIQVTEIDHEIYTLSFLSSSNSSKIEFVFNSKNSLTVFYPKFSNKALTFLYFLLASKKATTYIKREHRFGVSVRNKNGKCFIQRYYKDIDKKYAAVIPINWENGKLLPILNAVNEIIKIQNKSGCNLKEATKIVDLAETTKTPMLLVKFSIWIDPSFGIHFNIQS